MAKAFPNTGVTIIDSSSDLTGFSPSEGLMVFQKDTNELKIYDGSNWVSVVDTDTPPGMVYIKSSSPNTTNSISIDNCFSSNYQNYYVSFVGTASTTNYLDLRLRSNGVDAASNYRYNYGYASSGASGFQAGSTNDTQLRICNGDTLSLALSIFIYRPFEAQITSFIASGQRGAPEAQYGGGIHNSGTSYDGVTFLIEGGANFTGTIRVYGYRNSL